MSVRQRRCPTLFSCSGGCRGPSPDRHVREDADGCRSRVLLLVGVWQSLGAHPAGAATADGPTPSLFAWGYNGSGQLGNGSTVNFERHPCSRLVSART